MKTLQIIKQDQDKTISLVEHETSHTKYIQKKLNYLLIYNRVVDKMKVVYPFYESVIIKKPKKVNV